jgi:nicotinamide-nucleotide amidase
MKAYIITIGDELLLGQVIDTNSSWIGRQLADLGIEVYEKIAIQDKLHIIVNQLAEACEKSDIVLITGGLGPTKDDITKLAIAKFLNCSLKFNDAMYTWIYKYFNKLGKLPSDAVRNQCYLPEGVKILENKMGTAPGMQFEHQNTQIISMPGVPYEMKYIMNTAVLPYLKEQSTNFIYYKTISTYGLGESRIAERIVQIEENLPTDVKLAYLPNLGGVRLRISGSSLKQDSKKITEHIDNIVELISKQVEEYIFSTEDEQLVEAFIRVINEKGKTLAFAESCTGGFVSQMITAKPGVSSFYVGSVISYDNRIKEKVLNVSSDTLEKYGAVSEACVKEMLSGVLDLYDADIGASISGIAGPTGGSEEKPVGTIWVAYGSRDDIRTEKLQLGKDRKLNIEYTGSAVLNMLRKFLLR